MNGADVIKLGLRLAAAGLLAGVLVGCGATGTSPAAAPKPAAPSGAAAAPPSAPEGGGEGGEEATVVYIDPGGRFSFEYPQSWGKTTQPGEEVRFTGRDEFISVSLVNTALSPMEFGNSDVTTLSSSSAGYKGQPLKGFQIRGANGAVLAYSWQAGPSPVTGKLVPSSAKRYYMPGPGMLAIFTYSSPVQLYDPEGADDLANTFKWLR